MEKQTHQLNIKNVFETFSVASPVEEKLFKIKEIEIIDSDTNSDGSEIIYLNLFTENSLFSFPLLLENQELNFIEENAILSDKEISFVTEIKFTEEDKSFILQEIPKFIKSA